MAVHARLSAAIAFGPELGQGDAIRAAAQLAVQAAPALLPGSSKYAADYNEIKRLGGDDSPRRARARRTRPRSGCSGSRARRWPGIAWRARSQSNAGLDLWENARLFGLLNLAMADGYIASWDTKYHYKFWRPITAIRLGDTDGNPRHGGVTRLDAAAVYLSDAGSRLRARGAGRSGRGDPEAGVRHRRRPLHGVQHDGRRRAHLRDPTPVFRSYTSFSQAADENAVSRIYIGIHFRHAVEEGVEHGRKIADYAVHRFMKPAH